MGCLDSLEILAPPAVAENQVHAVRKQTASTADVETVELSSYSKLSSSKSSSSKSSSVNAETGSSAELEPFQKFGKYDLLEEIGRGGMGVVYRARQKDLDRDVALKMILSSRLASKEDVRRFYAEAKAAGSLRHSNIVGIHEVGEINGQHYFAPRGSASLRLNPKTRLGIAAGVYYQTPEFRVLTADKVNLDLHNEKSQHLILSLTRYLQDDLKFTAEVYYKKFNDLIVRNDRTNQIRTNTGDGAAAGIDLSLIKRFVNKLYGQINYSFARSKRDDNNGEGSYNSDFNQPQLFTILAGYE
ncbi:MAG: TonB-dependent receptor, partial [Planctomycetes bacterium]|nr:TonB-dependent receptor [Planctomycetota bacterium]